jgi:hypothetical protein
MLLKSDGLKSWFLAIALVLTACENKTSSSGPTEAVPSEDLNVPTEVAIRLEEISSEQCLNVGRYFEKIRTFPPAISARKLTKDLRFRVTGASLPRNAYLRAVAGNFRFNDTEMSQLPDFPQFTQEGCSQIKFNPEGYNLIYKIISAKKDSITFENEWDGQTTVTWKSPSSLELTTTSMVYDNLCNSASRGQLTVVEKISWGDAGIFRSGLSIEEIDLEFLSIVSQAKGVSVNSLYQISSNLESVDGERVLSVERLKELQSKPTRVELDQCY